MNDLKDLPDYLGLNQSQTAKLLGMSQENWQKAKRENKLIKTRKAYIETLRFMKEELLFEDFKKILDFMQD